jgi:hypothetical protein
VVKWAQNLCDWPETYVSFVEDGTYVHHLFPPAEGGAAGSSWTAPILHETAVLLLPVEVVTEYQFKTLEGRASTVKQNALSAWM